MELDYVVKEGRLLELLNAAQRLSDLEAAGVDNWEGYGGSFSPELEAVPDEFTIVRLMPFK